MNNTVIFWSTLTPLLTVLGGGVLSTLLEAFLPRSVRRGFQVVFSLLVLAAGLIAVVWRWTDAYTDKGIRATPVSAVREGQNITGIAFVEDHLSLLGQGVILVAALLAFLIIADRTEVGDGAFAASAAAPPGSGEERESVAAARSQSEIFPLALFATGGMMAFTSAFSLLSLFIALEVLSLPLYVLSATARRRRLLSQEAAVKYFLLGAFSSAVFLMGAALVYGSTGALGYNDILFRVQNNPAIAPMLVLGVSMVMIGLLFKVGAVPFHAWTPDVYQGAPTPISGFMAAGTKAAAFVALLRVAIYLGGPVHGQTSVFLRIVIVATVVLGTVIGLIQSDIKRLLAYSAIAHAGFILIAVASVNLSASPQTVVAALSSVIFYLLAYGISSVGAFGIVTLVREKDAEGNIGAEATRLSAWAGLGRRSPLLAGAMAVFLLSFAGIPLTAGFIGKFEVFRAGVAAGNTVLTVIAVCASAATAFFYFRLLQLMFLTEPDGHTAVVKSEGLSVIAITVAAALTVLLGVFPDPILEMIRGSFA
ncbi:NADH-quinone oxidoreductase subunit NuoN [Arcanobacterium sp. S3PF19]|uniref:NADH-quinone oxidoreductase subunit NuoN n=1 Tax=Arcanobacterium sp. S3PF19 TaxID=1219585 RepID=UPI00050DF592|nr:NADH-quinone oxidoreductase subunit NuoN [Arcanobacterium sp. S3PF19]KGF06272.1 NADH:ubiquinone oxidoreductase subunit N [Arcanobacterium sp. S3PF19]